MLVVPLPAGEGSGQLDIDERSDMRRSDESVSIACYMFLLISPRTILWPLGCLLHALCFFMSPYNKVFKTPSPLLCRPAASDCPFSMDLLYLIMRMLTPEM